MCMFRFMMGNKQVEIEQELKICAITWLELCRLLHWNDWCVHTMYSIQIPRSHFRYCPCQLSPCFSFRLFLRYVFIPPSLCSAPPFRVTTTNLTKIIPSLFSRWKVKLHCGIAYKDIWTFYCAADMYGNWTWIAKMMFGFFWILMKSLSIAVFPGIQQTPRVWQTKCQVNKHGTGSPPTWGAIFRNSKSETRTGCEAKRFPATAQFFQPLFWPFASFCAKPHRPIYFSFPICLCHILDLFFQTIMTSMDA